MKLIRYTLCSFLLIVVLIFACDSFQSYVYGFQGPYVTSFYMQPGITKEQMLNDIEEVANKYQVGVIFWKSVAESNWVSQNILYVTAGMQQYLEQHYYLIEGMHNSVFSGKTHISFQEFSKISEKDLETYPEAYFLIGEKDNIISFKQDLVETYAGSFPYLDGSDSRKDSITLLLFLWGIVCFIIWCTTYYNIISTKKEYFVKLTLGESPICMILRNIVWDIMVFGLIFAGVSYVLRKVYGNIFLYSYSVICFLILCIVNAGLYFSLLKFNIKIFNSNIKMSKKLLVANYVVKFILTFLVCVSLAGNLFFIQRYTELKKQESFYEQKKDYIYLQFISDSGNEWYLQDLFFEKFYHILDIQIKDTIFEEWDNCVLVNSNMKSYLLEKVVLEDAKDIKEILKENEIVLFLPKNMEIPEEELEKLRSDFVYHVQNEEAEFRIERYQKDISWNVNNTYTGYGTLKNPLIVYSEKDEWDETAEFGGILADFNYAFIKADMEIIDQFCEENNCRYLANNVYEDYMSILSNYQKGAMLNSILLGIQLVIQILLIFTIIKLEFESNRLELVLKKILGYSRIERFKYIYLVTLISSVLCMICIFIVQFIWKISYLNFAYVGALGIMLGEVLIISVLFVRQEMENIQKTIKGGYI